MGEPNIKPPTLQTAADCINKVMSNDKADRLLYSITVPLEAGFGKDVLDHQDIEAIFQRPDFPKSGERVVGA